MGLPSFADISSGLGDLTMDFVNNANLTLRSGLEAHEAATGIDMLGWAHDRAIQQSGDDRRSDLYAERERETLGFGGGYEPPTVQMENFEAMSHEQMKAAVESTNPTSMLDDARAWRNAAEQIKVSVTTFNEAIRGAIEGGWEGKGAESARATVARYATQSLQLEHAARLVANKIEEAHTGIDQSRQRMPEPESGGGVFDVVRGTVTTLNPVGGLMAAFHKSESARQHAVQVMTTEYAPVVVQADSQVPILPIPHGPSSDAAVVDAVGVRGIGTYSAATGSAESVGPVGSGGLATPSGAAHPSQLGGGEAAKDPAANTTDSDTPSDPGIPDPSEASADATDPSGASLTAPAATGGPNPIDPAAARAPTLPGGTSPASLAPGGGSIPGGGGAAAGSLANPGLVAPLAHGTQAAQATSSGSVVPAGRMTTPSMGGGFLPPGARRKDEESEHDSPAYLLNVANGSELIGNLPRVAPPVLGG